MVKKNALQVKNTCKAFNIIALNHTKVTKIDDLITFLTKSRRA